MVETLWDKITQFVSPEAGMDWLKRPRFDSPDRKASLQGRSQAYNVLDNIIGFDDDRVTPGEALGVGLRNDPVGLLSAIIQGADSDLRNIMFEGGAMQRPEDVLMMAAAPMAPNARGLLSNVPDVMSAGGAMPSPEILTIDPNAWRSRVEQSLPPSWLDPKFDRPQWHGISNVSSSLPPEEMTPVLRSTGTLAPEAVKTIENLVGRTGIPALGDRSIAGNEILGIGNVQYANPVRSLGGADFMREQGTGIWANAGPQAEDLAATAESVIRSGGDPALIFTAMGPQSADFSTMMAEAVMNQYDPRRISPEAAAKYDDAVRKAVPSFTSILNPNFLEGLTGTDRWNLWQLMDKAALRDAGFPDINLARRSITDPRLMDVVPFDAGLTIGRPTGGLLSTHNEIVAHPTYPAQLEGAYEGGLRQSIPGPILWRDFFNARRASGASPGSDQRSFLMNANRMAQNIDQQTVDEANQFMEYVRGLNDPTSPFRLWRGLLND